MTSQHEEEDDDEAIVITPRGMLFLQDINSRKWEYGYDSKNGHFIYDPNDKKAIVTHFDTKDMALKCIELVRENGIDYLRRNQ
jgi:hypothetical protein